MGGGPPGPTIPGLDVDSVTRKGKNADGQGHLLRPGPAGGRIAGADASGFPATREQLFVYDALVIAKRRSRFLLARAAEDDGRFSWRERGRRACSCSAVAHSFAARPCPVHRSRKCCRSKLNDPAAGGLVRNLAQRRRPAGAQPGDSDTRRRGPPDHAARQTPRTKTRKRWSAPAGAQAGERTARRSRRPGATILLALTTAPGGGVFSGRGGPALRPGAVDGLCRGSVVALER